MKKLFLFSFLFSFLFKITSSFAQHAILVASPELSESVYQEILAERKDLLSPIESAILKYQQQEIRPEIFLAADQCLQKKQCQSFFRNFEKIRQTSLISPMERQLLLELWTKSGKSLDCYWQKSAPCGLKKLSIESLGLEKNQSFVIFVDGVIYKSVDDIYLLENRKYHWEIISSRFQSKKVWATMEEVKSQVTLNNPYVTGGCLASSMAQGVQKEMAQNMFVAFDRTCVRKLDNPYFKPIVIARESWIDRNKVWVVSALAMTLGAGYYLHDKEVQFNSPFK